MNRLKKLLWVVLGALVVWIPVGLAASSATPEPPAFSFENEPAVVLRNYPAGGITEQEAFARHGGPVQTVTLSNGMKDWLYTAGEEAGVHGVVVLEFSRDDVVIEALNKSYRYKTGHSALQYPYLRHVEARLQAVCPAWSKGTLPHARGCPC